MKNGMSTRVYMGGLSYRVRERDVERLTRKFGKVREISLKNGYGFVEFDDYRDADDACYELNGKEFMGGRVTVELARGTPHGRDRERWGTGSGGRREKSPRRRRDSRESRRPGWLDKYGPPTRTDFRIVVENLSSRVSWQDLKDYMRQAGEVTYADAHKNRRNEGCVEFANEEDLKTAMEKLDGTEINGRKIKLIPDRKRRHSRSRSRSRSKNKRKSRSKSRSKSKDRRSKSRSVSKARSKSRSKSRSRSKLRSCSRSRSKSRSKSPEDKRENGRSIRRGRSRSSSEATAINEDNGGENNAHKSDAEENSDHKMEEEDDEDNK